MTNEEAIKKLKEFKILHSEQHGFDISTLQALDIAIKALEQEPKTGHWIKYDKEYFTPERWTPVIHSIRECSKCHAEISDFCGKMKYCPNCGAKMVEPQESDIEKHKEWPHQPCVNYEDGCDEWAGCPCVYYKNESEG